jgi:hypothetical protein
MQFNPAYSFICLYSPIYVFVMVSFLQDFMPIICMHFSFEHSKTVFRMLWLIPWRNFRGRGNIRFSEAHEIMDIIQFLYYPIYPRAPLGREFHVPLRAEGLFYDRKWRVIVKLMLRRSLSTEMCPGVEMVIENLTQTDAWSKYKSPGNDQYIKTKLRKMLVK